MTSYHHGLIVVQKAKYIAGDPEVNSGWRKNVFVRWDLVCQIFNHLSVNKMLTNDDSEEPIAEMTYLAPKQQTYDFSSEEKIDNTDTGEGANKNAFKEYIAYSPPAGRPTVPGDLRFDDQNSTFKTNNEATSPMGSSLDASVCLLPHQEIVRHLFRGISGGIIDTPDLMEFFFEDDENTIIKYPPIPATARQFTSYKECVFNENSIGATLFNIDFLISEYERIAITKNSSTQTQRIKPTINFNKYFNSIWEEVNAS
jgi:hypothetical protein